MRTKTTKGLFLTMICAITLCLSLAFGLGLGQGDGGIDQKQLTKTQEQTIVKVCQEQREKI